MLIRFNLVHYKDVAMTMCKYIELLRHTPPDERIFQELKMLRDIRFRFAERSRPAAYVSETAKWMQQPTPREKIISSQWVIERFDSQEISPLVGLLDVQQSFTIVTAKSMPADIGPLHRTEPVFGTRYRVDRMPEDFVKSVNFSTVCGKDCH
jgi:insulysin